MAGTVALPIGLLFVARLDEQQGNVAWAVPVGNITCTKLVPNAVGATQHAASGRVPGA